MTSFGRIVWAGVLLCGPAAAALGQTAVHASTAAVRAQDQTYEQLDLLVDVLNYIQENYVDESEPQKLIYGAASGMVRTLDAFSQFMEPGVHSEIKAETDGQFGGIGIRMVMRDDWLAVLTPMPGTPAYRAGLLPNDRLVEIGGETAKDLQVADAMDKLRGAPGTKVKIKIVRWPEAAPAAEDEGTEKEFELVRDNIKIESVQRRMLDSEAGYLRIIEFSAHTVADFHEAMRDLLGRGMKGLVLDLRHNPGGLLGAAVDVASSFLGPDKLVVYTQGRRPDSRQEFRSGRGAPYVDLPLIVLVNEESASGSEIIAGALQDQRRALLMGSRTFGKASVQSVIPLPDKSGLRLTVARYYTPNGRSIQRDEKKKTGGITPDISVAIPRDTSDKLFAQWELIYEPGKKPRSAIRKEDMARDEVLNRAQELIRARDLLGRIKGQDQ
ncbi:MAG: S41 family peptidase [Elusimicrobiota bacterium]|jgi:carboxyl-terminal processing protease